MGIRRAFLFFPPTGILVSLPLGINLRLGFYPANEGKLLRLFLFPLRIRPTREREREREILLDGRDKFQTITPIYTILKFAYIQLN